MKKYYNNPLAEFIFTESADVLTTSWEVSNLTPWIGEEAVTIDFEG